MIGYLSCFYPFAVIKKNTAQINLYTVILTNTGMTVGSRNNVFRIWVDSTTWFFKGVLPTYSPTGTV